MGILKFIGGAFVSPYVRVGRQLGETSKVTYQNLTQVLNVKTQLKDHPNKDLKDPTLLKARRIKDSKERFEFVFQQKNWTEKELARHLNNIKKAQAIYMFFTIAALLFTGFALPKMLPSFFFTVFMSIIFMLTISVFAAHWIQSALRKTQIQNRELMSFNEFIERADFWKKLFNPCA
ncbi:hypothetical protein [Allopusillimonas ginsengisoli]|uniref:hypothetical protein n=1 Tax=Allopusillimonas ginsengisoli TaxID=453575 RepID=UPI00102045A7|nr:hypothetical protein [Allopusillimonas ginsengisoli]TEA79483.1 hypothetical protein ERE07_00535 [Allopusillimonas ginsengisoli]